MKKNYIAALLVLMLTAGTWLAQTPQYWNFNTTAGGNTFPFGNSASNRKCQWRITANSMGTVGPGNNITAVYFMTQNTLSNTYPILNIKLKQNGNGLAGGGLFETGMTTVYSGVNVTKTGVAAGWMQFILTTPFTYDPSQPLLLEVEHNATSGTGPYINQSNPTGPGFGRQYGDYGQASYQGGDATVVHFGIDVVPNTPCTVTPGPNTITPISFSTCAGLFNPNLGTVSSYSFGGITYQWQSATQSSVGPYTSMPGYTNSSVQMPTLATTTWFQLVATCTNVSNGTTTLSPVQVYVYPTITGVAPYYESFENIQMDNRLPNCSWFSAQLGSTLGTYTASNTQGRVPRTGSKFASFYFNPAGVKTAYTHGLQLEPGVTYSASVWYTTEYYGYNNWTDLSILVGPGQNTGSQQLVASTNGPVVSNVYRSLSGTFTVPNSGLYYVAIRATSTSGSAQYLSWDDLAIEIPCDLNVPALSLTTNQSTVCANQPVTLQAAGVDTYSWSTGESGNIITVTPNLPGQVTYYVTGTSTVTGCNLTLPQTIIVNPVPQINAFAVPQTICAGSPAYLYASGATNYIWSNNGTGNVISVTPASSGTYAVIGSNEYNCQANAVVQVNVNQLPTVTVAHQTLICVGEALNLTASGAQSYQFISPGGVLGGNPATVKPAASIQYTVIGTDQNGCKGTGYATVVVDPCEAVQELQALKGLRVYPNPTGGLLTVELNTSFAKRIDVVDVTGRVVMSQTGLAHSIEVNMNALAGGVYYIKVTSQDATEVIRVVKQ